MLTQIVAVERIEAYALAEILDSCCFALLSVGFASGAVVSRPAKSCSRAILAIGRVTSRMVSRKLSCTRARAVTSRHARSFDLRMLTQIVAIERIEASALG